LRATVAEADTIATAFAANVRHARAARARHRTSKTQAYSDMYRARQAYRSALARYHEQAALFRRSDRRTKTAERGQRDALGRRTALRAAYADFSREYYSEWLTGHPDSSRAERLAVVRGLADACDVTVYQVIRDLGAKGVDRTREESEEDLRRYLAGMPVRAIARERRLTPQAVRNAIRRQLLARAVRGAAPDSDVAQ